MAPPWIHEDEIARLLTMPDVIAAVEAGLVAVARGEAHGYVRQRYRFPGGRMHSLASAWPARGLTGLKVYLSTRGAPGAAGFVMAVHDAKTGELRAMLDAETLGVLRTGALSGVATARLARPDVETAGLVGAGRQALAQLEAICTVRPAIRRVRVFSRNPERAARFAAAAAARLGREVTPVPTVDEAVEGAGVIVTITTAVQPFLRAAHLVPGVHVNAAGSNDAARAELAPDAVARATLVAVDALDTAREESGDLIQAAAAGPFRLESAVELGALLTGAASFERAPGDITLFESQGVGIADLAAAALVLERRGV